MTLITRILSGALNIPYQSKDLRRESTRLQGGADTAVDYAL
jgi:hypothetical protein